ncbi:MAG: aminotransferase class III-fold pyridoxal phosphate-dependent enzyme [Clostridia bacterium]|nr:aminotransferase class III-fold pyridoxal phosphate-dependent enzyme [Clostridia bacterium]
MGTNNYDTKDYIAKYQRIPYYPVAFEKGNGAILYDYNGKEYIDFLASASSANLGHGNKEVADAVYEQMKNITQYACIYFQMKESVDLAEKLISLVGRPNMQVSYSTTGSESIDNAIKLARAYTGRSKIISFSESYHGSTYGSISVSALSLNMRKKIGPLLPDVFHINYPDMLRSKYGKDENKAIECYLDELRYAFEHYIPADEVAALVMEPIAGDMGIVVPPKRYVQELYKICKENGILFIVDEIQQGFCRTGKWFSYEYFDIEPDLIVCGKSVGGGLPLGVVIGSKDIMNSLSSPAHVFTMSGNSTVCRASLKTIEILERENMNEQVLKKGEYLKNKLKQLMDKYDIIGEVRGLGLSIGVDLVTDRQTMNRNQDAAVKISYRSIENGLLLISVGQNSLRIQPPLVIDYEQMDKAVDILDHAFEDYINGNIGDEIFEFAKGW